MVDYTELNNMGEWERKKALYLIQTAESLGMDTTGYGMLGVNPNSGYTYLWLEDYIFTLYMPISCELIKTDIGALWSNPEDGEEKGIILKENTTLQDLENWSQKLEETIRE